MINSDICYVSNTKSINILKNISPFLLILKIFYFEYLIYETFFISYIDQNSLILILI